MKLDIFAKKDLKCFLIKEFSGKTWWWDDVAEKVMEWVKKRERMENEEKADNWFEGLPKDIKLSIAENLWYDMSYEDKMTEYTTE